MIEDNNDTLTVATLPCITPQSKFFAVELHFFQGQQEHVLTDQNTSREIHIMMIETADQLADIMIKGLVEAKFQPLCDLLFLAWDLFSQTNAPQVDLCPFPRGVSECERTLVRNLNYLAVSLFCCA